MAAVGVLGYAVGYLMPRRARLVLPVQPCGKTSPHAAHRHSPVASRMCPGIAYYPTTEDRDPLHRSNE